MVTDIATGWGPLTMGEEVIEMNRTQEAMTLVNAGLDHLAIAEDGHQLTEYLERMLAHIEDEAARLCGHVALAMTVATKVHELGHEDLAIGRDLNRKLAKGRSNGPSERCASS